jgi:hypothetical protein
MTFMAIAAVLGTTASAVFALAGMAALCRNAIADPLDRIACVTLAGGAFLCGVFALGDIALSVPAPLLNLLLLLNPPVAVAAAAQVDIFHTPLLYDLSPIAHRDFQYPGWPAAAALYVCAGAATFVAARALRDAARARSTNTPTY